MLGLAAPAPTGRRTLISERLDGLLSAVPSADLRGDPATHIRGLAHDSRAVGDGYLFFCVPGAMTDGHRFAEQAVAGGAVALVVERPLADVAAEVTQVIVPSVRVAMGPIASSFYGDPSTAMRVVGITGTNGKTTTTYLLESIARAAGITPGVIGTTGVRIDGAEEDAPHTTPEAPDVHALLARMRDASVGLVAMEVSSHGLDQARVGGVHFAVAAFTNLTQDHLDYHGSMERYFEAKAALFEATMSERGVINIDHRWGTRMVEAATIPVTTFGTIEDADVRATDVEVGVGGIGFTVDGVGFTSTLRGRHNVENCLTALACARALGIEPHVIAAGLRAMGDVPGRMEAVDEGQPFAVVVDYAHTPDGVTSVLQAARAMTDARVIIVVGCGGDRDRDKRPLMARAATSGADLTILTSDNPRSEDAMVILDEMEPGARQGGGDYMVMHDRRDAIFTAVASASPGDVVVIAGKGHETGQEFADRVVPFDDRIVARDALRATGDVS